jgi:hypothetical protein
MRRLTPLLLATALLVSCAEDGTEGTTTTFASPGTTSTTQPADTTTTVPAGTTTTAVPPTTLDAGLAPERSGCTPGTDQLPDGEWYVVLVDFDSDGITYDLACWFIGDAAIAASAEDGEESPPPNDYYVRNENELVRELAVASDVPVTWYPSGDPNDVGQGSFSDWVEFLDTRPYFLGIWVIISSGEVTEIVEQWVP